MSKNGLPSSDIAARSMMTLDEENTSPADLLPHRPILPESAGVRVPSSDELLCDRGPSDQTLPFPPNSPDTGRGDRKRSDEGAAFDPPVDRVEFNFGITRRDAVKMLGAGLLIAVAGKRSAFGAESGGRSGRSRGGSRSGGAKTIAARLHVGADGIVTVMTGKVEAGQGARAELTQAAAEELRLSLERVVLVMADTALVPDDGSTSGSKSTPSTVPSIRQGAAAAREILIDLAAQQWAVDRSTVQARDGRIVHLESKRELTYAELASAKDGSAFKVFAEPAPSNVTVTPVPEWKVLGNTAPRPNGRDLVTGAHLFPSDIQRPGMLYGKILRPPAYGAKLISIDLAPAEAIKDVVVVKDGDFVGVAASSAFAAQQAIDALGATAKWETISNLSSNDLFDHLRKRAKGLPKNPNADLVANAPKSLKQTYHIAYVQHAPLEPRAAVAEWDGNKLTVWTGTQGPFGVRSELARAFRTGDENVRVIVPDFGGGFGGKHSGECAVEAARLSRAARKPVSLRWTRQEEFTWAYFRPAGVIEVEASLGEQGKLTSWYFVNINSGPSALESPYRAGKAKTQYVQSDPPLRHGSYRALASTANTFARECFIDELAGVAGRDPLEFRLSHLENERVRACLEEAAKRFGWAGRAANKQANIGIGLACGTEKGSYLATCVEIAIDTKDKSIRVNHVCQVFDCGKVLNPGNLTLQNQGAIVMGLGPALREEIRFEAGKIINASFRGYLVPRFNDIPEIDVHLLDRPDKESTGAGETPLIGIAPAIANAVFSATGVRVRAMPIRLA